VVVMHEDCGLHTSSGDELTASLGGFRDLDETLRDGLERLRSSPELPAREHVRGFVFDPETGALREVG
jgi:carbonic anhydrase